MVEIIEKQWTKEAVLKRLGEALNKKNALLSMDLDASEIEAEIQSWQERYENIE